MCLYTQWCTADQTSMSEKHVYIKVVFCHRDGMTSTHASRDIAQLDMTLHQVGTSVEFGYLFGRL
jgi:hypothetical protein